ncbi:unnamed protein product, partial [Ectocarpus fasciculatus]
MRLQAFRPSTTPPPPFDSSSTGSWGGWGVHLKAFSHRGGRQHEQDQWGRRRRPWHYHDDDDDDYNCPEWPRAAVQQPSRFDWLGAASDPPANTCLRALLSTSWSFWTVSQHRRPKLCTTAN